MLRQVDGGGFVCGRFNQHLQNSLLGHDVGYRRLYLTRVTLQAQQALLAGNVVYLYTLYNNIM